MIDSPDAISIGLSLFKVNDGKKINKNEVQYLIQDAKQQIQKSYPEDNVIHIITTNYKLDENNYNSFPVNESCHKFSIDLIFICFPKLLIKNLENLFIKHDIIIDQILCSSYAKSLHYKEQFVSFDKVIFIDLGFEKTSIIIYQNEQLKAFNILSLGGNHITKDISKVLNLDIKTAEKIKNNLNKNILFSDKNEDKENFKEEFLQEFENQDVSLDLIKKIIHARIDEILNLSFEQITLNEKPLNNDNFKIILMGQGSKILNDNSIYIQETTISYDEIIFFKESGINICESGLKLSHGKNKQEVIVIPKKAARTGFFEKLFHLFQ